MYPGFNMVFFSALADGRREHTDQPRASSTRGLCQRTCAACWPLLSGAPQRFKINLFALKDAQEPLPRRIVCRVGREQAEGLAIVAGQVVTYRVVPARDGRTKAVNLRLLNPKR